MLFVWERSSHSQLSRGLIVLLPTANAPLPPGMLQGMCLCLGSCGSSPAAAEAWRRLKSRGSHMDLVDGLEMGSPFLHLHSLHVDDLHVEDLHVDDPRWRRAWQPCCELRENSAIFHMFYLLFCCFMCWMLLV